MVHSPDKPTNRNGELIVPYEEPNMLKPATSVMLRLTFHSQRRFRPEEMRHQHRR